MTFLFNLKHAINKQKMKDYLVVGGTSGIGLRTAELLAWSGNQVYSTFNSAKPGKSSENIKYFHYNALEDSFPNADLPNQLDGLVYCPGAINLKPFHRMKPEQFLDDYKLQVVGAVKTIQAVLPRLKAAEKASIVLFSTVAVQTGFNFHSMVSASKGAIEGLTRALAAEFAPGIRVNCVAPSLTETPLAERLLNTPQKRQNNADRHPLKRIGSTADIAHAVAFLLDNERSGWITGQIIKTDGGISSIQQ